MRTSHFAAWPPGRPRSLAPSPHSVFHNLKAATRRARDTPAIEFYGRSLSYRSLLAEVEALAGYLSSVSKVRPDDRVALCLQNCPQFIVAYYAILAANAVIVPISPMLRQTELAHILTDAEVSAVVFGQELEPAILAIWAQCGKPALLAVRYSDYADPNTDLPLPPVLVGDVGAGAADRWEDALSAGCPTPSHDRRPEDWCIIPYSSGTTGRPKGCLHTHASVNATIHAYPPWVDFTDGSRALATLPFCHVTGMQHSMNAPILTASTVHLMTRWDPLVAVRLIEEKRIEHWRSITTMMIDFLSLPGVEDYDLSSLKAIGGGGAQMPQSVARKMAELIGLDYVEAYGLTETMAPTHINPPHRPKTQCLGIPIFDVDARVLDPNTLQDLGPNTTGEIVVRGPQVFQEYWRRPEDTAAAFVEIGGQRFLRTGDIGFVDDEGYFFFVDRLKRMINVAGLKVWPAEVEAMLHSHAGIKEACVVGDPDPRSGEAVRAVVVLRDDSHGVSGDALTEWCRANMAAYKVPKRIEFRDRLPRSTAGKVLWRDL